MRDKRTEIMVFLILIGMVGLYYGLWVAWQKYQTVSSNPGSVLAGLIKGS